MTETLPKANELLAPPGSNYCLGDGIGFVALIQHAGDDASVVNSARVSFGKQVTLPLLERDSKLIRYLLEHKHGTPLEHTSLTFHVKCPLFVARQWHRHRTGISINEISARYVEVQEEFYIPAHFRAQSGNNRQASVEGEFEPEENCRLRNLFEESLQASYRSYERLLAAGVAREQARAVMPLSSYTQYYWTCNLRSLFHFVGLRDAEGAQFEIRGYAKAMLEQAREYFPVCVGAWEDLGRQG